MLNKLSVVVLGAACAFAALANPGLTSEEILSARPGKGHLEYQRREIMALIHWGLNVYTGQEWGYGNAAPSLMTAEKLDPAQWVQAIKSAGANSIVFVAKHHDGFCLWPSKYNKTYSMAAVPAPNTNRDLIREISDACRREGLKFGVYLSPWDRHQASYSTSAYIDYFYAQWMEVFENYGEICEIWLDGANGGTGWYGGANGGKGERRSISKNYYQNNRLLNIMHEKHPNAIAFGGGGDWSSAWCGNEDGFSPETWWCPRRGEDGKVYWLPSEADFPLRGGWFFHSHEKPKSMAYLVKSYYESVGRGAVMNIGIAPDKEGLVCQDDVKRLAEFGEWVRAFNAVDFAKGAKVVEHRDGNRLVVEINPVKSNVFNSVDIKEDIEQGQRVSSFTIEIDDGSGWRLVSEGTTVGYRRILRIPEVSNARVRVTLIGLAPPQILPVALRYGGPINGEDASSVDTYRKNGWKIIENSCPETKNAEKVIDGLYWTFWHTHPGSGGPKPPPQHFAVDCRKELLMHGFDYVPRLDGCKHGIVDGYKFEVSVDGKKWALVSEGEFGNIAANPKKQRITFGKPVSARYFRFTATHMIQTDCKPHAVVSEIDIW